MAFLSYFGFDVAPCSSSYCCTDSNEMNNEIRTGNTDQWSVVTDYPTVGSPKAAHAAHEERSPGFPAREDTLCVAKKHDFEEEIGDENAPPLPNAQAPKGQDPVKPKAEAAKPKDSEQKPMEFKAALADAKPKPKLPRPAKDESKPKLPKPQKAVAAPKAIEQPKIAGPFSDGSKLQVQLETGWVDCSDTEMMQIGAQLAGDSKKFAVHARGAMYIVDFTDPDALTQTHAVSKKTRPMRIVKP